MAMRSRFAPTTDVHVLEERLAFMEQENQKLQEKIERCEQQSQVLSNQIQDEIAANAELEEQLARIEEEMAELAEKDDKEATIEFPIFRKYQPEQPLAFPPMMEKALTQIPGVSAVPGTAEVAAVGPAVGGVTSYYVSPQTQQPVFTTPVQQQAFMATGMIPKSTIRVSVRQPPMMQASPGAPAYMSFPDASNQAPMVAVPNETLALASAMRSMPRPRKVERVICRRPPPPPQMGPSAIEALDFRYSGAPVPHLRTQAVSAQYRKGMALGGPTAF